jgi:sec-independent protein translocase protein TatA
MGSFSISHWVVVLLVVLILFGKGRISDVMADLGNGLRSFREGLADSDEVDVTAVAQTDSTPPLAISELEAANIKAK